MMTTTTTTKTTSKKVPVFVNQSPRKPAPQQSLSSQSSQQRSPTPTESLSLESYDEDEEEDYFYQDTGSSNSGDAEEDIIIVERADSNNNIPPPPLPKTPKGKARNDTKQGRGAAAATMRAKMTIPIPKKVSSIPPPDSPPPKASPIPPPDLPPPISPPPPPSSSSSSSLAIPPPRKLGGASGSPAPAVTPKELTKRKKIVDEILSTEETYLQNLIIMDQLSRTGCDEFGISEDERVSIFSNVSVLYKCHTKFLNTLRDVVRNWDDQHSLIGVLFQEAAWIKFYKYYVNDYPTSQKLVLNLRRTNKRFIEFLKLYEFTDVMLNQNIESLLVVPVQRIPRYVLLLQDLVKHTPSDHADAEGTKAALSLIKDLADYINRNRREYENREKLETIDEALTDRSAFPSIITAARRFLRDSDGEVLVNKDKRHVWLFNDMLLFGQQQGRKKITYKYRGHKTLQGVTFERVQDVSLVIGDTTITFQSAAECAEWCADLTTAIAESNDVLFGQLVTDRSDMSRSYLAIEDGRKKEAFMKLAKKFVDDEKAYTAELDSAIKMYMGPISKAPVNPSRMLDRQAAEALSAPFLAHAASQSAFCADAEADVAEAVDKHFAYFEEMAKYIESSPMRSAVLNQALASPVFQLWVLDIEAKTKTSLQAVLDAPVKRLAHYCAALGEILKASNGIVNDFEKFHARLNRMVKLNDEAIKIRAAVDATVNQSASKKQKKTKSEQK